MTNFEHNAPVSPNLAQIEDAPIIDISRPIAYTQDGQVVPAGTAGRLERFALDLQIVEEASRVPGTFPFGRDIITARINSNTVRGIVATIAEIGEDAAYTREERAVENPENTSFEIYLSMFGKARAGHKLGSFSDREQSILKATYAAHRRHRAIEAIEHSKRSNLRKSIGLFILSRTHR